MSRHAHSAWSMLPIVFGTTIVLLAVIAAIRTEGQVLLDPITLANSRGNNNVGDTAMRSCDMFAGYTCGGQPPGAPCNTCSQADFDGMSSGFDKLDRGTPGGGSCGFINDGLCDVFFQCIIAQQTVHDCQHPPGPPSPQDD